MTRPAQSSSVRSRELNIEHAPVRLDLPGLDRIVVVDRIRSALLSQLRNRRLHIAGLVDDAGFQQRRLTIPAPRQSEFRQRFRQHWLMKPRALPVDAAIHGDVDAPDLTVAGPRQSPDLIEAGACER